MKSKTGIKIFAMVWFVFSMLLMSYTTGDMQRLIQLLKACVIGEPD